MRVATRSAAIVTLTPTALPRASRVMLVHAHPVTASSFTGAVADSIVAALAANAVEVRRFDLHHMPDGQPFQPLLSDVERLSYFNEGQQPQLEGDFHVKQLVAGLRWCDGLVFTYPTWWFSIPGMLKGFFDRCFVPGVGFKYDHALGRRTVGLTNIVRCGVATSYGFDAPTVAKAGDAGRLMIQGGMGMLFHPSCQHTWDALYAMQAAQSPADRAAHLAKITAVYSAW